MRSRTPHHKRTKTFRTCMCSRACPTRIHRTARTHTRTHRMRGRTPLHAGKHPKHARLPACALLGQKTLGAYIHAHAAHTKTHHSMHNRILFFVRLPSHLQLKHGNCMSTRKVHARTRTLYAGKHPGLEPYRTHRSHSARKQTLYANTSAACQNARIYVCKHCEPATLYSPTLHSET